MNFFWGEIEWQKELKHEIRKGHKVPFLHLPFLVDGEKTSKKLTECETSK